MAKNFFKKQLIKLFEADDFDDELTDSIKLGGEESSPSTEEKILGDSEAELAKAVGGESAGGDSSFEQSREENAKINRSLEKQNAEVKSIIFDWVEKIEDFVKFLNDPQDPNSMRTILDNNKENETSPFSKISSAGRISNIASQLSALAEQLKGNVNSGVTSTVDL